MNEAFASDAALERSQNKLPERQTGHLGREALAGEQHPEPPRTQTLSDRLKIAAHQHEMERQRREAEQQRENHLSAQKRAEEALMTNESLLKIEEAREKAKEEAKNTAVELAQLLRAAGKKPDTSVTTGYQDVASPETQRGFLGIPYTKEITKRVPIQSNVWIVSLSPRSYSEPHTYWIPASARTSTVADHKLSGGEKQLLEKFAAVDTYHTYWKEHTWSEGFALDPEGHLMKLISDDMGTGLVAYGLEDDLGDPRFKWPVSRLGTPNAGTYAAITNDLENLGLRLLYPQ